MRKEGKNVINSISFHRTGHNYLWTPHWPLLYLDNHIVAVYKPSGLTVQGASTSEASLLRLVKLWIKIRFQKPGNVYAGLVHRLDKPVAGVCIFAKTSKAAARLSAQFRERMISKEYIAVVEGIPARRSGSLKDHIRWNEKLERAEVVSKEEGKEAILEYEVIDTHKGMALLRIIPVTGRRHQIRVQLAARGLTIAGDRLYGSTRNFPTGAVALYARKITFIHPTRREPISIEGPEPEGWPWPPKQGDKKSSAHPVPWLWRDLRKYIPAERILTKTLRSAFPS
ncbi:RluA family pseudouridine synthase [Thermodesulforhabdus norvegica]|uniref:Ribosomal large subunit pseudouridine synthase D n=1 Tax=Thermodesulforhabdus norvegica TaxID=39841 RepID=A0A1I4V5N5_9BACT|nr:RNA pseudouridine synthase [Thermodesulforhabdus norvegica]SFM96478.1 ribosomal large subunit pseudouridine synthase D [Thermodesulforhabdus norvegica]